MIAEIAHGLTWLAGACAALLMLAAWRLPTLMVPAALALGWLWLWISAGWLRLFWTVDLSVAAVAATTHSRLPEGLRLAAAMLSGGWLVAAGAVALIAAAVALMVPRARRSFLLLGGAALALHFMVLIGSQPFARLSPALAEGVGFNPAWRDRLASFGPTAPPVFDAPLAVGASVESIELAAMTPVAGEDSTGVLAEIRIARADAEPVVLTPEWRETLLPRHASSVPDDVWADGGWWRATLGPPQADGRWRVTVARLRSEPLLAGVLLALTAAWLAWRQRQ